jgi:Domain of unknown function (DUF4386)
MNRSWAKLAGGCGLVFTVLYYVGTVLLVGPITQDDSLEKAGKTFNEQADNFDVGASLLLLSIPFLLFFAQSLRSILARAEGAAGTTSTLVLVGAAAGAATTLAGAAIMGGTSFLAEAATVDGRTAAFSHSAAEACIFYGMVFFGVVALTTAMITLRHQALPRWFGWVTLVLGIAMVVGSAGSPLIRSLGLLAGLPTFFFFLIASVVVWRISGAALVDANQPVDDSSDL